MHYDVTVIGGGVVGLATAMRLSEKGLKTLVLERHSSFGNETSSRNSQVVHAGMYYPPGSLKAKFCAPGNRSIYEWCDRHNVEYRRTGKFIIAVEDGEGDEIEKIYRRGLENGVQGMELVGKERVNGDEPNVRATMAIWSPESGIVNSHELMDSFIHVASGFSCDFAWNHGFASAAKTENGYELTVADSSGESFSFETRYVVNSAGLESDLVAEKAGFDIDALGYRQEYCRGHYFRVSHGKTGSIKRLIYPVPQKDGAGLGIHVTLELDGSIKLGPDTEYLPERVQDYSVAESLGEKFFTAVSRYLPGLKPDEIFPDQSGIRPKLRNKRGQFQDFIIAEETANGFPGWVNLIAIESPGLTCCLQIAGAVAEKIG